jgi:hypothetical protein
MDHSEDSGTICAGTEEPTISNRSMHRRVKQREGRARRRAAKRENRSDAKDELGSSVDLSSGEVAAVASNMAASSPIMRQSLVPNSKNASTKGRICKVNDNNQISQKNQPKPEAPMKQKTMQHQGTGLTVVSELRRRPGPAQRNIRFFRELFESDTRPSDWSLACDMRVQYDEFPDTDQLVPVGRISALVWEIEFKAADVIDRPLRSFKEVKRLYVEKTKEIAFFKDKLVKARSVNNSVARNYFNTRRGDEESANDYRSLKYAELLLAYLIPILEVQQTKFQNLMEATGKAYGQLKACKRHYKQQHELRESVEQLKQRRVRLQKQIREEDQGGQQRMNDLISEWKRVQDILKEKKKSLVSDEDFGRLLEQHNISCQVYELVLRNRITKMHLCRGQAVRPTCNGIPNSCFEPQNEDFAEDDSF